MITDVQQYRIHNGDKDAFYTLCRENGLHVYRRALEVLHDESAAKSVAADALRRLREEILAADSPFSDAEAQLDALTDALLDKARLDRVQTETEEFEAAAQPETAELAPPAPLHSLIDDLPEPMVFESAAEARYGDGACRARKKGNALIAAFAVLLAAALLWLVLSVLMHLGILPFIDLGYRWFNAHAFNLFPFLT